MAKLQLVVIGALGQQGSSVIHEVLGDEELAQKFNIRGTTRDVSKPEAKALAQKGVEIVAADVNDPQSLLSALQGAHTVFASTVTVYDGHAYEHEVTHGKAIAQAAADQGVKEFVYSTLPNAGKISGGKLKHMGHFNGKEEVEAFIKTLPMKSSFFSPGCFMSNFSASLKPRAFGPDVYGLANFIDQHTPIPLIATAEDTGKWVTAILHDFDKYNGEVLCCATAQYSFQEIVDAMSKASGKTVIYKQVPKEVWAGFLPESMKDHLVDMFQHFEDSGYFGPETGTKVEWAAAQARGQLTTLDQYLAANPLNLE